MFSHGGAVEECAFAVVVPVVAEAAGGDGGVAPEGASVGGFDVALEFGIFFRVGDGELCEFDGCDLWWRSHACGGDGEGEFGISEFLAEVADEIGEVFFVFGRGGGVHAVVPSLVPADACDAVAFAFEFRELGIEVGEDVLGIFKDGFVVRADFAATGCYGAGWAEILVEAFAAPCDFDDEDGLVFEVLGHDPAEAEFRAEPAGVAAL